MDRLSFGFIVTLRLFADRSQIWNSSRVAVNVSQKSGTTLLSSEEENCERLKLLPHEQQNFCEPLPAPCCFVNYDVLHRDTVVILYYEIVLAIPILSQGS